MGCRVWGKGARGSHFFGMCMGSSLNSGPFKGPFAKGAGLYLGPKRNPILEKFPYILHLTAMLHKLPVLC